MTTNIKDKTIYNEKNTYNYIENLSKRQLIGIIKDLDKTIYNLTGGK